MKIKVVREVLLQHTHTHTQTSLHRDRDMLRSSSRKSSVGFILLGGLTSVER